MLIYIIIILMSHKTVITNYKLYMKNFWFKLNSIFRISSQLANSQSTYTKLIQFETESQRLSQIIEQTQLSRRSKRVSIFYNHTVLIKLLNKLIKNIDTMSVLTKLSLYNIDIVLPRNIWNCNRCISYLESSFKMR